MWLEKMKEVSVFRHSHKSTKLQSSELNFEVIFSSTYEQQTTSEMTCLQRNTQPFFFIVRVFYF